MCMADFMSYEKRECCSPACATHLARIMNMRSQNRYDPFCNACNCDGAFCNNRLQHYIHWRYTGPAIQQPIEPLIDKKIAEAEARIKAQTQKEYDLRRATEQITYADYVRRITEPVVKEIKDNPVINKKDIEGALLSVKKFLPKESAGLMGLGLVAGIVIKAYFIWTFAAGAVAAYAFKKYSDSQGNK